MAKVLLISVLLVFTTWCGTHGNEGAFSFHVDNVIRIVEDLERLSPELEILDAVELLLSAGHYDSAHLRLLLGDGTRSDRKPAPLELSQDQTHFISSLLHHKVSGAREGGVVLTPDGTSVAVAPLLIGIEAGLKQKRLALENVDVLYTASLAKYLGLSFVGHHGRQNSDRLGPDGCWDDVKTPRVFTLMGDPSPATDALINGALDGVILGDQLSKEGKPPSLSALLKGYYRYGAEAAAGLRPGLQSRFRRRNFAALVSMPVLQEQTVKSLTLHWELSSLPPLKDIEGIVREGLQDFQQRYLDCPPVIPRCMWGAQPYRGTPTNLMLPLSFLYIHHTYQPGQPCTSFSQCAADMRSMQRFHQEDRGWDDIGYSFVAGSDGYLYEGRGWEWQGAHTKGHNSKGYGVSFIGDFTSVLPDASALALVRDNFAKCAVQGVRLVPDFIVHGHRQVVDTSCPGDALYSEIMTWKHFKTLWLPPSPFACPGPPLRRCQSGTSVAVPCWTDTWSSHARTSQSIESGTE
ncbi:N-acetylmuramoyl-L-alanine amidase-like isoform X2 [Polyodon spathula]|uniref:N-acetylmuramoyl-L-alanine amidase-like isoform X2 n=1 Tax=Polyodon spathula TaxID=7913 RepID=UPI001B7DCF02|nr:N-acetylmuramoyl-L-alanine amidase-like isoform X2 [Polyodon spathula]